MKRLLMVFSIAVMMVGIAVTPASAKIIIGSPPPGPPALTGNFPNGATVTHCSSSPVTGGEGSLVINKNGIGGQGNCLQ